MMFSYGSGCAASMFVLNFTKEYKQVASLAAEYIERLAQRIKVTPADYDAVMAKREAMFGKNDYRPTVRPLNMLGLNCASQTRHFLPNKSGQDVQTVLRD